MKFKVVKESHETNYGHENLIIKGNIEFPIRNEQVTNTETIQNSNQPYVYQNSNQPYGYQNSNQPYGYQNSNQPNNYQNSNQPNNYQNSNQPYVYQNSNQPYGYQNSNQLGGNTIFNKQLEINSKTVKPVENQKDFFELYRYGINKLEKPNDDDDITFSISLFKPNSLLDAENGEGWMKRYFQNHLKQIILGNYFFPKSNYRTYLDYYMLAKFESFDGNDNRLKVTKYIDQFEHYDFEQYDNISINNLLINYYKEIKKYENYQFENGLVRILFYYDVACRSIMNNGKYQLREKTGDFFVYKFKGPFLERTGHISDGYIGQALRYISTIQKSYIWKFYQINRPTHLVWRDAHANSLGYNDFKWISELNKICKMKKNKIFFIPSSLDYEAPWNDKALCKVNNSEVIRSAIAGIVQFTNFTDDENFIPFDIYKQSIGMLFLLDLKDELPLKLHRSKGLNNKQIEYGYGIDEYVLSSMFNIDYFMENSIFFNHHWTWRILNVYEDNNIYTHAEFLLLKFMVDTKIISKDTKLSKFDLIKLIEELRSDYSLKDNKPLSLLLAIYPTKYFYNQTIFSLSIKNQCEICYRKYENNKEKFRDDNDVKSNSCTDKINSFEEILNIVPTKLKEINELTFENLAKININCYSTAINNALEWCTRPYIENNSELLVCDPREFLSGFYYDKQPNQNIAFLRSPCDLEHVINVLEKNKFKIKLNDSSYKLREENNDFKMLTFCNHDQKGNINNDIINKIINYDNIQKLFSLIPPELYSGLIWKALNSVGYDVPPQYFNKIPINDISKLTLNKGWINHTVKILTMCNHIKMDVYKQKYIKYKHKYLNLLNKL